jgi:hypothetical protein
MAGWSTSANDLVPKSRSATMAASTIPGTSVERMPTTGTQSFKPFGPGGSSISSGVSVWWR